MDPNRWTKGMDIGTLSSQPPPERRRRCTLNGACRIRALVLCGAAVAGACGGSNSTPTTPSTNSPTVTFSSTGISPVEVRIASGGTVTFLNGDARPHAVSSDPITIHTDCPAINDVGTLNPGQSRSTGVLTIRRTCGFHDHTNETDTRWQGRIIVE